MSTKSIDKEKTFRFLLFNLSSTGKIRVLRERKGGKKVKPSFQALNFAFFAK